MAGEQSKGSKGQGVQVVRGSSPGRVEEAGAWGRRRGSEADGGDAAVVADGETGSGRLP